MELAWFGTNDRWTNVETVSFGDGDPARLDRDEFLHKFEKFVGAEGLIQNVNVRFTFGS